MKNTFIIISLVGLLVMACASDKIEFRKKYLGNTNNNASYKTVAQMPQMIVGDKFVMTGKMIDGKEDCYNAEVVEVNKDMGFTFEITSKKGKHYLAFFNRRYQLNKLVNMNSEEEALIPKPPENILDFPLVIGKKWKGSVGAVHKFRGMAFYDNRHTSPKVYAFPIIGYYPTIWPSRGAFMEVYRYNFEYTVESFETVTTKAGSFKAFRIMRQVSFDGRNATFDGKEEYWYSPELKCIIKSNPSWRKGWELTEYKKEKVQKVKAKQQGKTVLRGSSDELPHIQAKPRQHSYAIVIGIEQYRQKLPKADFATADAKSVREHLTKVMGYPEENVIMLLNAYASYVDLVKYIEKWLPNNVEKESTVFVYYSGHGAPNPKTGDAYLVPYDGDPSFIDQTGYSLKRMYDALGKLPAKGIIVALDSCFSGAGGRSVIANGARPLVMNLQKSTVLSKKMTVLSASSGDQISSTYDEKGHGLFTYFLLKGLEGDADIDGNGTINIAELYRYAKPKVERIARKFYNNEQTPQLIVQDNQLIRQIVF